LVGKVLGNYRIMQKLGQGGVGEVWKAVDLSLDREVALKILRPELAAVPDVVARFRTEALALARLNHPNVATIHGFHMDGKTPFIVMELIFGQTLHGLVRGFGPMRSARALPLYFQVLDAIQHAHDHGIVHRDLKASNVMLSQLGVVKILDFGIARIVGGAQLTQGSHNIGTPAWMAPEQVLGEGADVRTDVYALGLLLYWLVTARLPFQADSLYEVQRAHVVHAPPPPREFAPDLPDPIEKMILRALAKRRPERFASVAEMRAALAEGFVPDLTVPISFKSSEETISRRRPFELARDTVSIRTLPDATSGALQGDLNTTQALPSTALEELALARAPGSHWPPRLAFVLLLVGLALATGLSVLRHRSASTEAPSVPAPLEFPGTPAAAARSMEPGPELAPAPPHAERKATHKPRSEGGSMGDPKAITAALLLGGSDGPPDRPDFAGRAQRILRPPDEKLRSAARARGEGIRLWADRAAVLPA